MDQFFRLNTYGGSNGFYIDNWILRGTTGTVLEADGKLFKSPTNTISSTVINSALPVRNSDTTTSKILKARENDADGDNQ